MEFEIAVIPQGSLHKYWKAVLSGAEKAVRDLGAESVRVKLLWKAPLREDDRPEQTKILEAVLRGGVDGVILAPFDSHTLVPIIDAASDKGIPTVIIDSALSSRNVISFIATDNQKGGALAAHRVSEVIGGKGRVLLLRYEQGSASTEEREEGFRARLRKSPE